VNLAIPKFSGLLYEVFEIFGIEHITWDSNGLASGFLDVVCNQLCFGWCIVSIDARLKSAGSHLHRYQIL
jgi:hypothetical protein